MEDHIGRLLEILTDETVTPEEICHHAEFIQKKAMAALRQYNAMLYRQSIAGKCNKVIVNRTGGKLSEVKQFAYSKGEKCVRNLRGCINSLRNSAKFRGGKVFLYADFARNSLVFAISNDKKCLLNGGLIWHESSQCFAVHT